MWAEVEEALKDKRQQLSLIISPQKPSKKSDSTADQNADLLVNPRLFQCTFLTRLQLVMPKGVLTTLPSQISQLSALQILILSNNSLSHLPDSIGNITPLKVLEIHHNQLEDLPSSFKNLTKLENLDLAHNLLTSQSLSVVASPNLHVLNLDYNALDSIATLPYSKFAAHLNELSACGNKIADIPADLSQLHALISLLLSRNQIAVLPSEMGNLKEQKLKHINLDENPLKDSRIMKILHKEKAPVKMLLEYIRKNKDSKKKKGKKGKKEDFEEGDISGSDSEHSENEISDAVSKLDLGSNVNNDSNSIEKEGSEDKDSGDDVAETLKNLESKKKEEEKLKKKQERKKQKESLAKTMREKQEALERKKEQKELEQKERDARREEIKKKVESEGVTINYTFGEEPEDIIPLSEEEIQQREAQRLEQEKRNLQQIKNAKGLTDADNDENYTWKFYGGAMHKVRRVPPPSAARKPAPPSAPAPAPAPKGLSEVDLGPPLDSNNLGFKMLAKMGYKEGSGLGKDQQGISSSVKVYNNEGGVGLGFSNNQKKN